MSISDSMTSIKTAQSRKYSHECRICGAPAEYSHFGVMSCPSCKIFFRRNGNFGQTKYQCHFDGHCEININTRHTCTACRLVKCFECGMSTEFFRASRTQSYTNALIKVEMEHHPEQLSTLNLLQSDQSLLSIDQWTLLSNLFHAYQESQLLAIGQRLIDRDNVIQSMNVNYRTLVQDFLLCIYETTGIYLRFNDDLCKLSSNDRSIMLHNAANNVSCMTGGFALHHCDLLRHDAFSNTLEILYGKRSVDIHLGAMKFIDPDIVVVKLAISLFAFSESTYSYFPNVSPDLTNSLIILAIQNKYAEVTWKYLLYRYGHYQAVRRLLNIISWLEAINVLLFHAQSLTLHVNDVNSLAEQTEVTFILNDVDQILDTNQ